jgi:predicted DNA-binding transcriptional regulator AlpA
MSEQLRFLCLAAVIEMAGVSKTSVYAGIPDFPKPVKIHGAGASIQSGSRWVESEVTAWMQSRIAQRDAQRNPTKAEQIAGLVSQ